MSNPFNVTKLIRTDPFYHQPMEGDLWYLLAAVCSEALLMLNRYVSGGLYPKELTFGHKAALLVATSIGASATTRTTDILPKCGIV